MLLPQSADVAGRINMQVQNQYDLYLAKIQQGSSSGDLNLVEATVFDADRTFGPSEPAALVRVLRAACDEVNSHRFTDQHRAQSLVEQWAVAAIRKANKAQIDVQIHLLTSFLRIRGSTKDMTPSNWAQKRQQSAELWFGVWRKLEEFIDPSWSLNDPKYAIKPYVPPAHVQFDSGMSPEDIQDPKIRREYEAHLLKNHELMEFNKGQLLGRKLKQEYSQTFEDYIVSLYSAQPFDPEGLGRFLVGLKDKDMKERILQSVRAR